MKPHEYVILEVARERERQMEAEGWTPEHDDTHNEGEMARAAASYAYVSRLNATVREIGSMPSTFNRNYPEWVNVKTIARMWPWDWKWFKPTTPRRDLIKAAALIIAEIERLDRAASPGASEGSARDV